MNAIMLELRNVADVGSGHQRGAWTSGGGLPGLPEIVDLQLAAGRLAVGSIPGLPAE